MPAHASPPVRLRPGRILVEGARLWLGGLRAFAAPMVIALAPAHAFRLGVEPHSTAASRVHEAVWMCLMLAASAAVARRVLARLAGREVSLGFSLGVGLRLWPSILVIAVVQLGMVWSRDVALQVLLLVAGKSEGVETLAFATFAVVLSELALLAVLTPFWLAVPAAVAEKGGLLGPLWRSVVLTRGLRIAVFAILLLLTLLQTGLRLGFWAVGGLPHELLGPAYLLCEETLAQSAGAVLSAAAWHRIRLAKEGPDQDEVARVFE